MEIDICIKYTCTFVRNIEELFDCFVPTWVSSFSKWTTFVGCY